MSLDQAIATLREFRLLNLGPRLSEAIDVVVAELERNPFRSGSFASPADWRAVSTPAVPPVVPSYPVYPGIAAERIIAYGGIPMDAPKHNAPGIGWPAQS